MKAHYPVGQFITGYAHWSQFNYNIYIYSESGIIVFPVGFSSKVYSVIHH